MYHITDLPSFVSGEHLVILVSDYTSISYSKDPHAKFLPGDRQTCGKRWNFCANRDLLDKFSDQLEAYKVFGCDMQNYFPGTLFRFPLRTPELAPQSQISKIPYTYQSIQNLITSFKREAPYLLLFLKHVECIAISVWSEGEENPTETYSVSIGSIQFNTKQFPRSITTSSRYI